MKDLVIGFMPRCETVRVIAEKLYSDSRKRILFSRLVVLG